MICRKENGTTKVEQAANIKLTPATNNCFLYGLRNGARAFSGVSPEELIVGVFAWVAEGVGDFMKFNVVFAVAFLFNG